MSNYNGVCVWVIQLFAFKVCKLIQFSVSHKCLIAILIFSLIKVDIYVNCGPVSSRARTTGASSPSLSSGSNNFNSRRRDIFTDNRSQRSESTHVRKARI